MKRVLKSIRIPAMIALFGVSTSAVPQTIQYLSTDEAIALEHQTRYSRLRRFVESYNINPPPEFHDYVVTAANMPATFRHDVPVLRVVFPENTFFNTASDQILPSAYPIIRAMAKMLDGDVPDVNVFVAGHTDSRGGEDYNHNLSIRRAKAVTTALASFRTQSYPIWSIGFGESLPLYPNTTDANMSYNRRVEFLLGARPEAVANWLEHQYDLVCQTGDPAAKLRCLLDVRAVRRAAVAEEEPPRAHIAIVRPDKQRVAPDATSTKLDIAPRKMTIQLDERRLYVQTMEH